MDSGLRFKSLMTQLKETSSYPLDLMFFFSLVLLKSARPLGGGGGVYGLFSLRGLLFGSPLWLSLLSTLMGLNFAPFFL